VLSGGCPEGQSQLLEGGKKRERLRLVYNHALHRDHHRRPHFQEAFPKRRDLSLRTIGARGTQAQLLHENVGSGCQQHLELVGPKPAATGAVDLQRMQFFYSVLPGKGLAVSASGAIRFRPLPLKNCS
jgi:hypothetical protein